MYIKTLKNKQGEKVKLIANIITAVKYKALFGGDIRKDINDYFIKQVKNGELYGKYAQIKTDKEFDKLTTEEKTEYISAAQSISFNTEFLINFTTACVAAANSDLKDIEDIQGLISVDWLNGGTLEFKAITELMLEYHLPPVKKN